MVDASIFIPLVIVAITQMVKIWFPTVSGKLTILIALVVGVVIALIDGFIGVTDINIATGVMYALEAIGITAAFAKAGGGARGDNTPAAS